MLKTQTLKVNGGCARIFRPAFGPNSTLLSWDRSSYLDEDSTVEVGEPLEKAYDHRTHLAVPIVSAHDEEEGMAYILFHELSSEKQEEVRALFPECPLLLRAVH